MCWYHQNKSLGIILVLHVDDVMVAGDGSKITEEIIETIHKKYPFGEWCEVRSTESILYTGRTIRVVGTEIWLGQEEYIKGRMSDLPSKKNKNRAK